MNTYSVLIVDDEFPARKQIIRMLNQISGYTAAGEARNGEDGFSKYRELKPDIVLTDIEMPVMNGLEMIRLIREQNPAQVIIILSCYESFSYAQQAIRCNVQDYLIKDMTKTEQLEEVLRRNTVSAAIRDGEIRNLMHEHIPPQKNPGIPVQTLPEIEKQFGELSLGFLSHNFTVCESLLLSFGRVSIQGFSQFCFMQYILDMIINWIGRECVQYDISSACVFKDDLSPLDLFMRSASVQEGIETLILWIRRLFDAAPPVSFSPRIANIILFISDHFAEELTLQRISDEFHISPVYLSRSFKAETGKNIISYINIIRVEKAKLLLTSGQYQVNEIAYMVGFHNSQNFYNTFKKTEGTSPAEFLQKLFPGNEKLRT